jgi:hypothetical protein
MAKLKLTMKSRDEWSKELASLGVECCGFWKLDEAGKIAFITFLRTIAKVEKPSGSLHGESMAPIMPPSAKGGNSGMRTPGT